MEIPCIAIDEEWRKISDYIIDIKDNYYLSNYGRVYSTIVSKVINQYDIKGYYCVYLYQKDGRRRKFYSHRLVLFVYDDRCPFIITTGRNNLEVNHRDTVTSNNYYKNLEWMTSEENYLYSVNLGNNGKGENNPSAKITEDTAKMIINDIYYTDLTYNDISIKYNCGISTVAHIGNGNSWKHLERPKLL